MNCRFCACKLRSDNKSGHCHPTRQQKGLCAVKLTCKVCGKTLSRKNKGDTCRLHRTQSSHYRAYQKKFRVQNAESIKAYKAEYREVNVEDINQYYVTRRATDVQFKLAHALRVRLTRFFKSKKVGSAVKELGCSLEQLKAYLESKFTPGMSWENYGPKGWHIDHIHPLSKYDLTDPEQLKKACHYSNLQPLWAIENMRKGNRIQSPKSALDAA